MMRQTIDEYLDGMLDAQARAAVEQTLARDPAAAELARSMRAERAVRSAVYDSYRPSQAEASALAGQILAACEDEAAQPVGRILPQTGRSIRWLAGIAAAMAIAFTAFQVGRLTAPAQTATNGQSVAAGKTSYVVYVKPVARSEEATPKVYNLASYEEYEMKIRELEAPLESQIATADIWGPGRL